MALVAIALSLVGAAGRGDAAQTSVALPSSIDVTGKTDSTAALNVFFASLGTNTTVEFPAGARLRVDGVFQLINQQGLILHGNASTLVARDDGATSRPPGRGYRAHWPRLRQHVAIRGGVNIEIDNLGVEGPNTSAQYRAELEGQAAFAIAQSQSVKLDGVNVNNVFGDGVYVAGNASEIEVVNASFDGIGRQGIAVVSGSHVSVHDSAFDRVARSVFDLEPLKQNVVVDTHFSKNTVGAYANYLLSAGGGAKTAVNEIWLNDNSIDGGNGIAVVAGVIKTQRHGLHIVGNRSSVAGRKPASETRSTHAPITVTNFDTVEISKNVQRVAADAAIELIGVCHETVVGNVFQGTAKLATTSPCGALPVGSQPSTPSTRPVRPRTTATSGASSNSKQTPRSTRGAVSAANRTSDGGMSMRWVVLIAGVSATAVGVVVVRLRRGATRQSAASTTASEPVLTPTHAPHETHDAGAGSQGGSDDVAG